jgi:hypothetical protein
VTNPTDEIMFDAIEGALWQDLADALNRLSDYGLDVVAGMAEKLGHQAHEALTVDAGDVIGGGGVREPDDGYYLRYQPGFTPGPDGADLPSGWVVAARKEQQR